MERACQTGEKPVESPEMKGTEGVRGRDPGDSGEAGSQETLERQAAVGQPHREMQSQGRQLGKQSPSTFLSPKT